MGLKPTLFHTMPDELHKRAVHTLESNETAIGVTDCHAYANGQVMCLSQGGLDGPICFGKLKRHIDGFDG